MEVVVAHGKNGTQLYASGIALLRERVREGYWYDTEEQEKARGILRSWAEGILSTAEDAAWNFLLDRSDHEYEGVELQQVID